MAERIINANNSLNVKTKGEYLIKDNSVTTAPAVVRFPDEQKFPDYEPVQFTTNAYASLYRFKCSNCGYVIDNVYDIDYSEFKRCPHCGRYIFQSFSID